MRDRPVDPSHHEQTLYHRTLFLRQIMKERNRQNVSGETECRGGGGGGAGGGRALY